MFLHKAFEQKFDNFVTRTALVNNNDETDIKLTTETLDSQGQHRLLADALQAPTFDMLESSAVPSNSMFDLLSFILFFISSLYSFIIALISDVEISMERSAFIP